MKKVYRKPDIFFESFMMSSSIANECDGPKGNSGDPYVCEYEENGMVLFNTATPDTNDCEWDDIWCYHVTADSQGVFGS